MTDNEPKFHMPVIGAPPAGQDPTTYYAGVALATTVQITAADHQGLYIELSNPAYSKLFAMAGGLVSFIPPGKPLPTSEEEFAQGAGALVLEIWIADFYKLKKVLPPGVPAMTYVLYLNVKPDTARTAFTPHVKALPDSVLQVGWNQPSSPPDRAALEANYLDLLLNDQTTIWVPGGTLLGEAAESTTNPTSPRAFVLRFTDANGNDLSPILHLRSIESYGGPQWHDHPLITGVSNIPVPVNIYLQFEMWNESSHAHEPLPPGVAVDLMDWDPGVNDKLITELTDANGRVHFSTSLEALDTLDPDDAETDLFFLVHTNGLTCAGHTLSVDWSTKGWLAADGSPGYYDNFTGSQIGEAATPLVFRIGFDFHVSLSYEDGSQTGTVTIANGSTTVKGTSTKWKSYLTGMRLKVNGDSTEYPILQVNEATQEITLGQAYAGGTGSNSTYTVRSKILEGMPVTLMVNGHAGQFLTTDNSGNLSGVVFDIMGEDTVFFHPSFEIEDSLINLPKAKIGGFGSFHFETEYLHLPDNQITSLGAFGSPYDFCHTDPDLCAGFYMLKVLKELSTFLFNLTQGEWTGVFGLQLFLTSAVNHPYSWPVGEVNIPSSDHFDRSTIIHEVSHQVMWKKVNATTLGIAYQGTFGDLILNHRSDLLSNPEHALIEGWAEFVEAIFEGRYTPPYSVNSLVDKVKNPYVLGPPPRNRGESVEGAFANGLWEIFRSQVHAGVTANAHVPESADGDVTSQAAWIKNATVQQRFLDMIWNPLKDLTTRLQPESTHMIEAIKTRNLSLWHLLQAKLQAFNMAMDIPSITSISPSSGPKTGGQTITVTGTDFVVGMTVEIGGSPVTNIVSSSTSLTAITPVGGAAGPVDVIIIMIDPQGGSSTLSQGYTYVEAPGIASVSPASGPKAGGQSVVIIGAHFVVGVIVRIGGNLATNVVVSSSTQLTAQTPGSVNVGPADVVVETIGGSSILLQGYTYQ